MAVIVNALYGHYKTTVTWRYDRATTTRARSLTLIITAPTRVRLPLPRTHIHKRIVLEYYIEYIRSREGSVQFLLAQFSYQYQQSYWTWQDSNFFFCLHIWIYSMFSILNLFFCALTCFILCVLRCDCVLFTCELSKYKVCTRYYDLRRGCSCSLRASRL